MDAFVEHLLIFSNTICPLAIRPRVPHAVHQGILVLCIAGEERELPLMPLFAEYCRLGEGDRPKFLRHVFLQYIIRGEEEKLFGCSKAGSLADKKRQLMPLLASQDWIKKKSEALPKGLIIPTLTFDGQEGIAHGFGICLVMDNNGSLVLNSHLQAWGSGMPELMGIAIKNLKARTPVANCWVVHPSGCVVSNWADGYDATRAILMPELVGVDARKLLTAASTADSDSDSDSEGDTGTERTAVPDMVASFATQSQLMASPADKPIALCFMGQVLMETFAMLGVNTVNHNVFRLRTSAESGRSSHTAFRWEPYAPGPGEYSIPQCAEESRAIMVGAHCGQVPVFHHPAEANSTSSNAVRSARGQPHHASKARACDAVMAAENDEAEQERQRGNQCFKHKRWEDALQHYSAAIRLAPDHRKLVPMANRAAVWLELGRYMDAVADCDAVLCQDPHHRKALYRRGCAHQSLQNFSFALRDFEALREIDPESRKAAAVQISKTTQLRLQWQVCQWTSEVIAIMLEPKGSDAIPGLLSKAVGWSPTESKCGRPGWMPKAVRDTVASRVAALELYSMLRDEWVTARDAATCSAYAQLSSDLLPPKAPGRDSAAIELAATSGVHSFIILGLLNHDLFHQIDPYQVPIESRSLYQIVASITLLPEIQFLVSYSMEVLQQAGVLPQLMVYKRGQYQCF
eukprot:GGOE01001749.1.p1 GENE.GGOE01001749.1~~GGOE01001749.1.p1  ORF type:complete len:688 (+),score=151.40 GGOE01001749.1:67-2130(+)